MPWEELLHYINGRVHDRAVSKELQIGSSLDAYLFGAAKYQILGYIRSEKMQHRYAEHLALFAASTLGNAAEDLMDLADLKTVLEEHLASCRPSASRRSV